MKTIFRYGLRYASLALLWCLVLVSAIAVVWSSHQSRLKNNELEQLRQQAFTLEVERGRYLLEQSAWATYSRIEMIATDQLNMQTLEPSSVIMVESK